jgi:hypothetical protein
VPDVRFVRKFHVLKFTQYYTRFRCYPILSLQSCPRLHVLTTYPVFALLSTCVFSYNPAISLQSGQRYKVLAFHHRSCLYLLFFTILSSFLVLSTFICRLYAVYTPFIRRLYALHICLSCPRLYALTICPIIAVMSRLYVFTLLFCKVSSVSSVLSTFVCHYNPVLSL